MESMVGSHKFDYCIVGHSGDSDKIPLVEYGKPPANQMVRAATWVGGVAHPNPHFLAPAHVRMAHLCACVRVGGFCWVVVRVECAVPMLRVV
jgi:hypothetical protein